MDEIAKKWRDQPNSINNALILLLMRNMSMTLRHQVDLFSV